MSLGSPWMLLSLALVPLLVLAYVAARPPAVAARRRGSQPKGSCRPRRPGAACAGGGTSRSRSSRPAIALVCVALARPTMSLALPQREGTVILAFDVSNSMRANDLEPTRIAGREGGRHARSPKRQPSTIRIGVVAFGDSAVTVLRPTNVKEEVLAAIRRLSAGRRHVARPGPLHVAQHDRRQAAADRRVRARERRRRGRHRVLRLVGDRPALRRREHLAARSAAARRGRVVGGRPRPRDRDRDAARERWSRSTASASRRRSTRSC